MRARRGLFWDRMAGFRDFGRREGSGLRGLGDAVYSWLMVTVSVDLSEEVVAALDRKAKAKHLSRAAYVREALVEKVGVSLSSEPISLLERTSDLCGVGDSGLGDLSSDPRYLNDFGR